MNNLMKLAGYNTEVVVFDTEKAGCKTKKPCSCNHGAKGAANFTGKVVSNYDNEILVGATIYNKNSQVGVMTDFDGNFKAIGSPDDIVQVSFVGHKAITLPLSMLPKVVKLQNDGMLDAVDITPIKTNVKAGLIVAGVALAFWGYSKYNETGTTTKRTTKTVKKKVTA
ncbi:carboxypeptidase-like regulatory domain-containing protein [Tenacibaculum piscium]|uniref:carboxypeptidase-like regulatory domain-containing protein n=1 Tax=Tenacibaculum piscium TaxID=1458515 RepID=UPI001F413DB1|nr:carboxypeptidase-like regulatory domain-containing protein [Tenacibaculum piscium]